MSDHDCRDENDPEMDVFDEKWPSVDEPLDWALLGIKLLRAELKCALNHLGRDEYGEACTHLSNIDNGTKTLTKVIFTRLCNEETRLALIAFSFERLTGQEADVEEIAPGVIAFTPKPVDVPDTVPEAWNE